MADKIYADGLFGNEKDGSPDFVVGNMAVAKDTFMAWLEAQDGDARGYVRLNVTRQKKDPSRWSFSLDTWQPKEKPAPAPQEQEENLPF